MRELLTVPRILELGFNLLGVGAGIAVIVVALRVGATFTLLAHRRVMRLLVATAILIVASEGVGIMASLSGPSTLSDAAEEFAELVAIGAASVTLLFMSRAERDEISALRHCADVDNLTGLSSRSFFHRAAARRIELARANDIPVACVLLDIDDFKAYNDMHGHGAGDDILRCVARALRSSARADDLVARYGGEEFVLLASGDVEDVARVAARVRRVVRERCVIEHDDPSKHAITVSSGVVPLTEDTGGLERLVEMADAEMYHAKKAGKNRVSVFNERSVPQ
jgi:diguanylate cyclase (GGDEF)-like protein